MRDEEGGGRTTDNVPARGQRSWTYGGDQGEGSLVITSVNSEV